MEASLSSVLEYTPQACCLCNQMEVIQINLSYTAPALRPCCIQWHIKKKTNLAPKALKKQCSFSPKGSWEDDKGETILHATKKRTQKSCLPYKVLQQPGAVVYPTLGITVHINKSNGTF